MDQNETTSMTNPYRAMCAELVAAVDDATESVDRTSDCVNVANYPELWAECMELIRKHDGLLTSARALLAQPVPEGPTLKEVSEFIDKEAPKSWNFGAQHHDVMRIVLAALARFSHPTPQPPADGEAGK